MTAHVRNTGNAGAASAPVGSMKGKKMETGKVFYSDQILHLRDLTVQGRHPRLVDLPRHMWNWAKYLLDQRGMANFYSTQITNLRAKPVTFLKPSELVGRLRVAYWSYTTPASGAPGIADFIALTKLPKDGREIAISAVWEAMSSGAGTAGADFGVATDDAGASFAADYATALNMDAAGFKHFDAVIDKLPRATPLTAERWVHAKVTGEALAVSKKLQGHVLYVVD